MSKYETPLSISIPLPEDITYMRGEHRRYKEEGRALAIRLNNKEAEITEQAAKILGVRVSHLMRHCAVKYAEKLVKHRSDWTKEQVAKSTAKAQESRHDVKEPNSS